MNPFPTSSPAAELLSRIRRDAGRPALVAGPPRGGLSDIKILELGDEELLGAVPADGGMAAAVKAGLLLLADRMDESHSVSQGLDIPEGSYWHGILHRREPDYGNARHWFRALGDHPLFDALGALPGGGEALDRVACNGAGKGRRRWDPFRFIDLVEECVRKGNVHLQAELEELQLREMELLLEHCYRGAVEPRTRAGKRGAP